MLQFVPTLNNRDQLCERKTGELFFLSELQLDDWENRERRLGAQSRPATFPLRKSASDTGPAGRSAAHLGPTGEVVT